MRNPAAATVDDLRGAVLVYEYRFAGRGTKVFATDDMIGVRTVIAAEEARVAVAEIAIRKLMRMGAVMSLISLDGASERRSGPASAKSSPYITLKRTRVTPRYLAVGPSLDATLATLGDDTRRNFRRYRRRVEAELGAEFIPRVRMGWQEFQELNRRSTNPADGDVVGWRYGLIERSGSGPETMFAGLRAADGRWLSLVGGRRYGKTTELDWQMNLAGLPRFSLCTAMRAYLLEHEIARGTKRLVFEGGTPHPMRFSFRCAATTDILAIRRQSTRAWVLRRFSKWIFPQKNFLASALREMREEADESHDPLGRTLDRAA
jgi:hypothetical protein